MKGFDTLSSGWQMARATPGELANPAAIDRADLDWIPATVPGTVADSLRRAGLWTHGEDRDFDAEEWWYRCRFPAEDNAGSPTTMRFYGLATFASVWLNGENILESDSMFVSHDVDVTSALTQMNELLIRFASLNRNLESRPRLKRPRWKTRLVTQPRLREARTTLLGRMPGWLPAAAPVGPWRPIEIGTLKVLSSRVNAGLDENDGVASAEIRVREVGVKSAQLRIGNMIAEMSVSPRGEDATDLVGSLRIPDVERWWPHTHGSQTLFPVAVTVTSEDGDEREIHCGRIGFRSIEQLDDVEGAFGLRVNGVPVFCRGACWTPLDFVSLNSSREEYRERLEMVRDGGMNMLRVGGTMVYESADFHDLCDELGILVWQDAMFANMDYPESSEEFMESVATEMAQLFARIGSRPSTAVLCGGSEVAQQAAMMGLPRDRWRSDLFEDFIPAAMKEAGVEVPYVPSTPWGGPLPFQPSSGITHYYGVGAYLRPMSDARTSGVKFASECLAFSNVPANENLGLMADRDLSVDSKGWKSRVPRDSGASWDFEDVRDHYLAELFQVVPQELRANDPERYLALSRVVTGEVMERVISEWRREASGCNGALVWLLGDPLPGAGWGVIDSAGNPKAAWHYLKRVMQPVALLVSDEGLNGLWLHAINDTANDLEAMLTIALYRTIGTVMARGERSLKIPAHGSVSVHADELFDGFLDLSYAYRFGPPGHDVCFAELRESATGHAVGRAFHFPSGLGSLKRTGPGLDAIATRSGKGFDLDIRTNEFAESVEVQAQGFRASDSFFHIEPGGTRQITLVPCGERHQIAGTVTALNGSPVPIRVAR